MQRKLESKGPFFLTGLLAAFLLVVVGGCGSDDHVGVGADTTPDEQTTDTVEDAPAETIEDQTPDPIPEVTEDVEAEPDLPPDEPDVIDEPHEDAQDGEDDTSLDLYDPCTHDAECPAESACMLYLIEDSLASLCGPWGDGVGEPGDCCDPMADPDPCRNALCRSDGYCSALCRPDASDCPDGFECVEITVNLSAGGTATYHGCRHLPCTRGGDCVCGDEPRVCRVFTNDGGDDVIGRCRVPSDGGLEIGEPCDPSSETPECATSFCSWRQYCSGICESDEDCRVTDDSMVCTSTPINLGGGVVVEVDMCNQPIVECTQESECVNEWESCQVYSESDGEGGTTYGLGCFAPSGTLGAGEECESSNDCWSDLCLSSGYCSLACQEEEDCPDTMNCGNINISSDGEVVFTFSGCVQ